MFLADGKLELPSLTLQSGQARSLELEQKLASVEKGPYTYEPVERLNAERVDVSKTTGGYALRLRMAPAFEGTCVRCLEPARIELAIDAREVHQPGAGDDELISPYVNEDDRLDLDHWANDSVVLDFPAQPLCRPDCAGLCPECGVSLNDIPGHAHEQAPDSRFAALKDLKLEE